MDTRSLESVLIDLAARVAEQAPWTFDLEACLSSLPAGLFAAERVRLVARAPADAQPLAAGSRWFAAGYDLFVELPPDLGAHLTLLESIGVYRAAGRLVAQGGFEALRVWDVDPDRLSEPSQREIEALGARPIEIEIEIEIPDRLARMWRQCTAIAERLHDACEDRSELHWVVLDDPSGLELLSPYVGDLGPSIYRWAREHPEQVPVTWTERALVSGRLDLDVIVPIAQRLLAAHPELVDEKARAERSVGMQIERQDEIAFGHVDLERLHPSDPRVRPEPVAAQLLVLASPNLERAFFVAAALARWREPVSCTLVARAPPGTAGIHLPPLARRGAAVDWAECVRAHADQINLRVESSDPPLAFDWAIRLSALTRRVPRDGGEGESRPLLAVRYGVEPPDSDGWATQFDAVRLALSALCVLVCPQFVR